MKPTLPRGRASATCNSVSAGQRPESSRTRSTAFSTRPGASGPGVFLNGEKIDLTPEHLVTCGSALENVKLFNSNLQVIDEAFEYLVR